MVDEDDEPVLWDGEARFGPSIAFGTATDLNVRRGHTTDLPVMLGIVGRRSRTLLRRDQLGEFLRAHPTSCFVCYDAPGLFWGAARFFEQSHDELSAGALWKVARERRLYCLRQFSILFYMATEIDHNRVPSDHEEWPVSIGTWASALTEAEPDRPVTCWRDDGDPCPVRIAEAIYRTYRRLRLRAISLLRSLGRETWSRWKTYGPLSLGLQVQGRNRCGPLR